MHDAIVVTGSYERIFAIVGIIFLITYLTKRIPDLAQSLIGGISSSGWGDVKDIKGMAAATAGAVAGAAFSAMQALAAGKSTNNEKSSSSEGGSTGNPTLDAASAGGGATGSGGAENNDSNPAALPNEGSGASPENPKTSASNDSKKTDSATSTKNSGRSRVGAVAAYAARAAKAYGQARLQTTVGRMIDPTKNNNATPFNVGLKIRENMMSKKISGSGTSQDGNKK